MKNLKLNQQSIKKPTQAEARVGRGFGRFVSRLKDIALVKTLHTAKLAARPDEARVFSALPIKLQLNCLDPISNSETKGNALKESNTIFDGTYFHYTCPHCGMKSGDESADPKKNPYPFSFMPRCTGCGKPKEPDFDVIVRAHSAISSTRK